MVLADRRHGGHVEGRAVNGGGVLVRRLPAVPEGVYDDKVLVEGRGRSLEGARASGAVDVVVVTLLEEVFELILPLDDDDLPVVVLDIVLDGEVALGCDEVAVVEDIPSVPLDFGVGVPLLGGVEHEVGLAVCHVGVNVVAVELGLDLLVPGVLEVLLAVAEAVVAELAVVDVRGHGRERGDAADHDNDGDDAADDARIAARAPPPPVGRWRRRRGRAVVVRVVHGWVRTTRTFGNVS